MLRGRNRSMRAYRMNIPESLITSDSARYAEIAQTIIDDAIASNDENSPIALELGKIHQYCPECDKSIVFDANHAIYRNHIIIGCEGYFTLIDSIESYDEISGEIG